MADNVRVEIGFIGGGSTAVVLTEKAWAALRQALEKGGDGALELETEAGDLYLRADQVAFLRTQSREGRVGF
jgi:hypothetical protein